MKAIIEMVLWAIIKPMQSIGNTCACVNYNYFIKCVLSSKDETLKPQILMNFILTVFHLFELHTMYPLLFLRQYMLQYMLQ